MGKKGKQKTSEAASKSRSKSFFRVKRDQRLASESFHQVLEESKKKISYFFFNPKMV